MSHAEDGVRWDEPTEFEGEIQLEGKRYLVRAEAEIIDKKCEADLSFPNLPSFNKARLEWSRETNHIPGGR